MSSEELKKLEELLAKYKALFPDNVEAIVVRKDDYDRLYGDLTIENIELKQEIERLQKENEDLKYKLKATERIFADRDIKADKYYGILFELEKWLNEEKEATVFDYHFAIEDVLNKIKELKGEDKE